MAVLEIVASVLNWIMELLVHVAHFLLCANYHFIGVLIDFVTQSLSNVCCTLQAALVLLHCYLIDFCTFVEELAAVLYLVIAYVVYVLQSFYVTLVSLTCSIVDVFQSLFAAAHIVWILICCAANHIATVFVYISKLLFQAVILLLMLLPNAFLGLYNVLVGATVCMIYNFKILCYRLKISVADMTYYVKTGSVNILYSIPPKAYVGLLILILLYYARKPVTQCIVNVFLLLIPFLCSMIQVLTHWIHTGFLFLSYLITKPFILVLQLMPARSSSAGRDEDSRQRRFLFNKLSFSGVFRKVVGAVFHHFKSADINFNDPDQVMHLRYLEQKLNEERDRHLCIICQDELRTILLLPCRHLCLCRECWESLEDHSVTCPVCRRTVQEAFPVYV